MSKWRLWILFILILPACIAEGEDEEELLGEAQQGLVIAAPSDPLEPPETIYVLPVVLVPTDFWLRAKIPDPQNPNDDLNGNPISSGTKQLYDDTIQSFSNLTHIARYKYRDMLRNPKNDQVRATFEVAEWVEWADRAETVSGTSPLLDPLVVESDMSAAQITAEYQLPLAQKTYTVLDEVLERADCHRANCPFVFAIATVGSPYGGEGALRLNLGYSTGGFALLDYEDIQDIDTSSTFMSTYLHELGHAFGLLHSGDLCTYAQGIGCNGSCSNCPNYSDTGGPSVMAANNTGNQIFGCPGWVPTGGPCGFPAISVIENLPGTLLAEDIRMLSLNKAAFDLSYEKGLDAPGVTVVEPPSEMSDLAGSSAVPWIDSSQLAADVYDIPGGVWFEPHVLLGATGVPGQQFFDQFDLSGDPPSNFRSWQSATVSPGDWVNLIITFPRPTDLRRIRVFSGHSSGTSELAGLEVKDLGTGQLIGWNYSANANSDASVAPGVRSGFTLRVRADSTSVVLREIRLFGMVGGTEQEIYPAAETKAISATVGTYGGDLADITGADQKVYPFSYSWSSLKPYSWHSQYVGQGTWMSMTIELPEERELGYVKVHTGHSGYYHAARQVQVERECLCGGNAGEPLTCTAGSALNCYFAGGPGNFVFEYVDNEWSSEDHLLVLPHWTARRWKIAMRAANAFEQPVNPGYIVVRGIRLFDAVGGELFPPRYVAYGL